MRVLFLIVAAAFLGCRHRAAGPKDPPRPTPAELLRGREAEHRRAVAEAKRLYEAGVDAYAKGDLGEARRFFEAVLDVDPQHLPAQKALRRLSQRERQER